MPPIMLAANTRAILRLWTKHGLTQRAIAAQLGLGYTVVNSVIQKWKLGGYKGLDLSEPTGEPSVAMVRLAQFDPVVARALRIRLGGKDGEEP